MQVQLVAKTTGLGKYENLTTEEIVSAIARHGVIKEDNGKLIKYLMKNAHWSPLDMINFTFEIETSRAIGRQILRHASIKFQEHSQRYSGWVGVEPIELRKEHLTNRQSSTEGFNPNVLIDIAGCLGEREMKASDAIEVVLSQVEELYVKLIDAGVAKECARMIVPECAITTMSANGSLRSWLSFLNVRMDIHTQKECTNIATLIGEALEKEMPNVFSRIDWRKGMFL